MERQAGERYEAAAKSGDVRRGISPSRLRSGAVRGLGLLALSAALGSALGGCSGGDSGTLVLGTAETCMTCHNGSPNHDYAGPGIENPHPFGDADNLTCTQCHGGNP
ncbi:MAG: hypothetical protein AAFP86_10660, partial [Planctomycetota bacterium]